MYVAAACLALAELVVFWLALHPHVSADYRAYYIDKTTTCLNQPVAGYYVVGTELSFRSQGYNILSKNVRVCGWDGPAGDGLHSVGKSSRLRFAFGTQPPPTRMHIAMTAITHEGAPLQRVDLVGNDIVLGSMTIREGKTQSADFDIPAKVFDATPGRLELTLDYRDAVRMSPTQSDTQNRAIKLLSARLYYAGSGLDPAADDRDGDSLGPGQGL